MGNEKDGGAGGLHRFEAAHALVGEAGIADGEGLINDQGFRALVDGGREGEADIHAGGVFADGAIKELAEFGEVFDGGQGGFDFAGGEAHEFGGEADVFAASELEVEAGAEFENGADAAPVEDAAEGGLGNASEDLQERGLARPVGPNEAEDLTGGNIEGDVAEGPELRGAAGVEAFGDVLDREH